MTSNPFAYPQYDNREQRERRMEDILIDLTSIQNIQGFEVYIPHLTEILDIYRQAEDRKE